jgi:UTP-glucose-1-phosphate uridylyltransferase
MANLLYRGIDACISVEHVSDDEVSRYGIVEVDQFTGGIERILEKPSPTETDSRWAVAARFAFSKPAMGFLMDFISATHIVGREITLSDVVAEAIARGQDIRAVPLQPEQVRVDCGSPEEYMQARRLFWD